MDHAWKGNYKNHYILKNNLGLLLAKEICFIDAQKTRIQASKGNRDYYETIDTTIIYLNFGKW